MKTFENGKCPVWKAKGVCNSGWKCRFVGSHSTERECDDGRKELVLVAGTFSDGKNMLLRPNDAESDLVNVVKPQQRAELAKKKRNLSKSDAYIQWLDKRAKANEERKENGSIKKDNLASSCPANEDGVQQNGTHVTESSKITKDDNRAQYMEPPFLPSEKRRILLRPRNAYTCTTDDARQLALSQIMC